MKKVILVFLTLVICLAGNINVLAKTKERDDTFLYNYYYLWEDFSFELSDNETVVIKGYNGEGGKVEVPSYFDDIKVTAIGSGAFQNCTSLYEIILPSSIESIGANAFKNCENLKSLKIDRNAVISEIGKEAFYGCKKLSEIEFPYKLYKIGSGAFEECIFLRTLTLPSGIERIGTCAFAGCKNLKIVNFPDGIKEIGGGVLNRTEYYDDRDNWCYDCLYVGQYLISSGDYIYFDVRGNVQVQDDTTLIAEQSFDRLFSPQSYENNNIINSIEIPESVESIGVHYSIDKRTVILTKKGTAAHEFAVKNNLIFVEKKDYKGSVEKTEKGYEYVKYTNEDPNKTMAIVLAVIAVLFSLIIFFAKYAKKRTNSDNDSGIEQ